MRPLALALGVLTLVGLAAIIGLSVYAGMPVTYLPYLFLDAELITKLVDMVVMLMIAVLIFLPRGSGGGVLLIFGWLTLGLGLLGTLYNVSMIMRAMQMSEVTDLRVTAPGMAEGLLPLTLGLLAVTIAAARAGKRPAEA